LAVAAVLVPVVRRVVRRQRNELLAHLEAEKQRDQTTPEPWLATPFYSAGRVSIGIGGTLPHHPRRC